jgi:hypothetical protein
MEPRRQTAAELLPIQDQLIRREPIFHRAEFGTTRADFDAIMAADFWEIGASGKHYSRAHILDVLQERHEAVVTEVWQTKDFYCQPLAEDLYLLAYTLLQGERVSRRATIWRRVGCDWQIVFHQGTIVAPE